MALALALLLGAATPPLKVGVGVADVSPPAGYRMAGSYSEKLATGVRDPILAKALYFEQSGEKFVLVVCDVCGMERKQTDDIRTRVSAATGAKFEHVCVSATHTHGGPMHHDPVFIDLFGNPDRHNLGDYPAKFKAGCVDAATAAFKSARPATLEVGTGRVPGLTFNRRFVMKDGSVGWNPGKKNPNIVRPAGPTDDSLPLVLVRDSAGKLFASLCAFAMHTTTYGGDAFSADHPGHLQVELRKHFGNDFVSVFAEGCAGDCNQVDVTTDAKNPTPEQAAAKIAAGFRATRLSPLAPSLKASSATVKVPLRDDRPNDLAASRDTLVGAKSKKATFLEHVEAYQVLLTHHFKRELGDPRPLPVHAFRLGADFAIVTLPHEVFVEIGLEIKKRSPFKHTLIVTIANEVDCYVPTAAAFDGGNYEVVNCPYKRGVGERLAADAIRQLEGLAK